ncbi:MAG: ABC transporter ATP-binding protein [Verrucomicrobia bacterium]|nr:ABC transporter ATP-binding protein [Verrucomicrobiota bacterium]
MTDFLLKIWRLALPYRSRLLLGVLTGFVGGLIEPLMIATVTFVYGLIFPSAQAAPLVAQLQFAPDWFREWLASAQQALTSGVTGHRWAVVALVGTIPAILLLRGLFGYLNIYLLQWVATRVVTDLRVRLFDHLLRLSAGFFSRANTGELMSRITNDTSTLQQLISYNTATMVKDPVTLLSLLGWLLWLQPKLTLISLLVLPVCALPIVIFSRKVRHSSRAMQAQLADLGGVMSESFSGIRVIKAYNLEPAVTENFRATARRFIGHYMRIVRATETPGPLIEFVGAIGISLVLVYLALQSGGRTGSADFLAVILAMFAMYRPLKNLTRLHNNLEQARAASERVFELLATQTTIPEPAQPKPVRAAGAEIQFDGVDFAYGEKAVLRGFSLTIQPGQLVALVGPSGSGKTTVTSLLLRFYDPQRGAVRIGGTDLREFHTRDLRGQIAVVTQETVLFNDTVRRNIELGRPGAGDAEIVEAARHAHALDFIMEKPDGFATVIGEKGGQLSGGQRQRLAIARAILKNAPILVLDEATSSLDTESERAVQAALEELMQGRTTICIAHRLSTVQNADVIVVLDRGRIVETGRHSELIRRGGLYQKLYEMQFQG